MKVRSLYHQERLGFMDYFEENDLYKEWTVHYNIPLYFKVSETEEEKLQDALVHLLNRHDILRTRWVDGEKVIPTIEEISLPNIWQREVELLGKIEKFKQKPLDSGYHLKVYYDTTNMDCTEVLFIVHCAIVDEFSLHIIQKEYTHLLNDPEAWKIQTVQYKDFLKLKYESEEKDFDSLLFFWKSKLKNGNPLLILGDKEPQDISVYREGTLLFEMEKEMICSFSKKHHISARSLFLAAYKMAFYKLTGFSDILIGTYMDLREEKDGNIVGPMKNFVALRSMLKGDKELLELCKIVDETWKEAEKHKIMPYGKLIKEICFEKDLDQDIWANIMYTYSWYDLEYQKLGRAIHKCYGERKKGDFDLSVEETSKRFNFTLKYNKGSFNENTAGSLLNLTHRIVQALIKEKKVLLKNFSILPENQKQELLDKTTSSFTRRNETIISAFQKQVRENGKKIAISWSEGKMEYSELDELSNRMANVLIHKFDIRESDCVAVILPKSEHLIVALMAILKCDAMYVLIHPNYSEERRRFILEDTSSKLIIDERFVQKYTAIFKKAKRIPPKVSTNSESIANIIYTSGKTAPPKGVMIKHSNVIALLQSCNENFELSESDSWTLFHSYCYDFSAWEIFGCLLSGGNLVIVTDEALRNQESLAKLMNEHKITVFTQKPLTFYNFIESNLEVPSLRYVVFGREPLDSSRVQKWNKEHPEVDFIKMHGITESTVHITFKKITPETLESPLNNIGKPMSFTKCYVLNKEGQLLPFGWQGELYVGGEGVAYGYLNNPKLDAERFRDDPFSKGGKMYRTGDRVRYLSNGELEYLGRIDH